MPFKSQKQRAWMYATHPKMAQQWQAETPKAQLPEYAPKKKKKTDLELALDQLAGGR